MSERQANIASCEVLCEFFGVFYRKLPSVDKLEEEMDRLKQEFPDQSVVIHTANLKEENSHFQIIKSFLKQGKLGRPNHVSVSNYMDSYVRSAIEEYPNDLIVVMLYKEGDIIWDEYSDRKGHNSGYPIIPYDRELYGNPLVLKKCTDITHIPPDRIIGFYYVS